MAMPGVGEQASDDCQQQKAESCGVPERVFANMLQMIVFDCTNPHIYIKWCRDCSMLRQSKLLAAIVIPEKRAPVKGRVLEKG